MVKHLVMWRLRRNMAGETAIVERERLLQVVADMRTGIEGLRALELGFHEGNSADAADIALCAVFQDWAALQSYEQHPLHLALKDILGPIRSEKRVVDYEISLLGGGMTV
jgi:hypothetical protein